MGGQHGFGPVAPEADEPVFHHAWEGRAMALTVLMGASGAWNIDQQRATREALPPVQYLSSSYYEIWIAALEKMMLERGIVSLDELLGGQPLQPALSLPRTVPANQVMAMIGRGGPSDREPPHPARFAVGDTVRTRVMNPLTHTRLPRYARGRCGQVVKLHGAHVFPDVSGRGLGEDPQWLYTVRFDAHEIWGPDTTATAVHADCWEPYLVAP
jgi:nitrile hydratase